MNSCKDIYKRKKTLNDINLTTGLHSLETRIDIGCTPYVSNSNSFDNEMNLVEVILRLLIP